MREELQKILDPMIDMNIELIKRNNEQEIDKVGELLSSFGDSPKMMLELAILSLLEELADKNIDKEEVQAEDAELEVSRLMIEIDTKIQRFTELTNHTGKQVKKRWRDIKKSRSV